MHFSAHFKANIYSTFIVAEQNYNYFKYLTVIFPLLKGCDLQFLETNFFCQFCSALLYSAYRIMSTNFVPSQFIWCVLNQHFCLS